MIFAVEKLLVKVTDGIESPAAEQTGAEIDVSHHFPRLAIWSQGARLEFAEAPDEARDDIGPVRGIKPVHLSFDLVPRPSVVGVEEGYD